MKWNIKVPLIVVKNSDIFTARVTLIVAWKFMFCEIVKRCPCDKKDNESVIFFFKIKILQNTFHPTKLKYMHIVSGYVMEY